MYFSTLRLLVFSVLTFLLSVAASSEAHAQREYEPGYILTAEGDTTRGFIENLEWQRAPTQIQFFETETSAPDTLTLDDIAGFGVGEYTFERQILKVDQRPIDFNQDYPKGEPLKRDTLFLRRLVTGPLTLYSSYTTRPHFFIETSDRTLQELVYFVRRDSETGQVRRARFYRQQLANRRTEACKNASTRRLDFAQNDLIDFVASCNASSGDESVVSSRFRVNHVISVRTSWTSSRHDNVSSPGTLAGVSPGISYQLQIESREKYSKGAVLLGVGVQRMRGSRTDDSTREVLSPSLTVVRTPVGDLSATVLDVSTEVRYRLRKANWRPFVSAKQAVLIPLSYEASMGFERQLISTDAPDTEPSRLQTGAQDWTGLQLGAGGGVGVEGPRFGTHLSFFYGFGYERNQETAPPLLDVELKLFVRL